MNYSTMGMRIAEVRRSHKMTQEKLCRILGLTSKHLSHVENDTSCLSLPLLIKLCNLFGCSLDYIVMGNSNNALSKLPQEISSILDSNNEEDINLLNSYLEIYVKLLNK